MCQLYCLEEEHRGWSDKVVEFLLALTNQIATRVYHSEEVYAL